MRSIKDSYVTDRPRQLFQETLNLKSQGVSYRCVCQKYVYTIEDDDTCAVTAYLWSAPKTYDQNKVAFDTVMLSLRRWTPSPEGGGVEEALQSLPEDPVFKALWSDEASRLDAAGIE